MELPPKPRLTLSQAKTHVLPPGPQPPPSAVVSEKRPVSLLPCLPLGIPAGVTWVPMARLLPHPPGKFQCVSGLRPVAPSRRVTESQLQATDEKVDLETVSLPKFHGGGCDLGTGI